MDVSFVKDGEWIYPENGISFNLNPEKDRIVKATIYPSCSAQDYKDKIYYFHPQRAASGRIILGNA